jgi:hypothetical protein
MKAKANKHQFTLINIYIYAYVDDEKRIVPFISARPSKEKNTNIRANQA